MILNFWKRVREAVPLATLFLLAVPMQASVMDAVGNYLYGGFTGPLSKGLAVVGLVLSIWGMKKSEGRVHDVAMSGAIVSGGILAAPLLVTEFQHAVGG